MGDTKTIVLNGTVAGHEFENYTVDVVILGFDHNRFFEGKNRVHFGIGAKDYALVGLCDENYSLKADEGFIMNPADSDGNGWADSYMRINVLGGDVSPMNPTPGTLLAALPSDLREVMAMSTKYTDNSGTEYSKSSVTATEDSLFLLSEYEFRGENLGVLFSNSYEQKRQEQYAFFQFYSPDFMFNADQIDVPIKAWCRSPYKGTENWFCLHSGLSGWYSNYSAAIFAGFTIA